MAIYTQNDSLKEALSKFRKGKTIALVPTMGALHEGHLSLIQKALTENDCVVVSIFVNPTQFNNSADLNRYPRTLEADLALLSSLNAPLIVYAPDVSELYPKQITSSHYEFGGLEIEMEGKHRQGHFDGVGTIVSLLFKIIQPDTAYFGEKDFQQLQIIKTLVKIEKTPVKIIGCPIVREENGLAKSSRNKLLDKKQLQEASIISKTLKEVRSKFNTHTISQLNKMVRERFLKASLELEYFEIANEENLKTAKRKQKNTKYRGFIAAFAGPVRLIDNMPLN